MKAKPTPHQLGIRVALAGVLVNLLLAVVKIASGVVGHSHALVADGVESAADILSSIVVMGGLHFSAQPADSNHPYGHGKAEPMAGVVVSSLLLLAAAWIAWTSLIEIRVPHDSPAPFTLGVLAAVVVVKEYLSRRVIDVGQSVNSTAVLTDGWHHRFDALTSGAAFVGISIALLGGPGYETADDWAALVACGVIAFNGVQLFRKSADDLMDASASPEMVAEVRELAASVPGVQAIEKCRVRKTGLELSMDIHVMVDGALSVRRGHEIAHAVKDRLTGSGRRIVDVTVHIEPAPATDVV